MESILALGMYFFQHMMPTMPNFPLSSSRLLLFVYFPNETDPAPKGSFGRSFNGHESRVPGWFYC